MSIHKNHKILLLVLVVICSHPFPIVVISYIQTTPIGKGRLCETRYWEHKYSKFSKQKSHEVDSPVEDECVACYCLPLLLL